MSSPKLDGMLAAAWQSHQAGRLDEAEGLYRQILGLNPDHVGALHLFGLLAGALGRHEVAVMLIGRAVDRAPGDIPARNTLGNALVDAGRLGDGLASHRRTIALDPQFPNVYTSLGNLLSRRSSFTQAATAHRRACLLDPTYWQALANLGTAMLECGHLTEATATFRRALDLRDEVGIAINLAHALLTAGRFDEGWRRYERRLDLDRGYGMISRSLRWTGQAGQGGTLLIHAEQGLGDMLQFCRYVPLAAARGWRVVVEVHAPLIPLMRRLDGVADVVARGAALPPFDAYCPMLSLPGIFGTTLETVPAAVPYLTADPAKAAAWRPRVAGRTCVGLAWAGNPQLAADGRRSLAAGLLAPLLDLPGITFFRLQKDRPAPAGVVDLMAGVADFGDTAALVANLDLVIAVDSAVAHLAGAMGRPVWLLNRFDAEWRWLRDRDDSPWYPTLRQFRQTVPGHWPGVIARVRAELARMGDPSSSHWQKDAGCSI